MKRFGGTEFLPYDSMNTRDLVDEQLIGLIMNITGRLRPTTSTIDATKIASLFRVHSPQVSVDTLFVFFLLSDNISAII
jgi:hypothetical protein